MIAPAQAAEAPTAPVEPALLPAAEAIVSEPPATILDQASVAAPPVESPSDVTAVGGQRTYSVLVV